MASTAVRNQETVEDAAKRTGVEVKVSEEEPVTEAQQEPNDDPAAEAIAESEAPTTNEERQEAQTQEALEIVNEPPAPASGTEPDVVAPIVTKSPDTPLAVVVEDESGKPQVQINPDAETDPGHAPSGAQETEAEKNAE